MPNLNQKNLDGYKVKSVSIEIKDINSSKRTVVAAISSFNTMDSDNDIIKPGAFTKSIQERGPMSTGNRKILHLRDHDWTKLVGRVIGLEETEEHLVMTSVLGTSTTADDTLKDYRDGLIREHSIGFQYLQDKINVIEDEKITGGRIYEINEVILFEGSAVAFGANENTPTLEVGKMLNKPEIWLKYKKEMDLIASAVRSGGTDERLYELEMRLKVLQSKIDSLINFEPITKDDIVKKLSVTQDEKPIDNTKQFYLELLKKLK